VVPEISNTVNRLLDDPALMEKMGRAGMERWRNELNLRIMVDRWEKYMKEIVNGENR